MKKIKTLLLAPLLAVVSLNQYAASQNQINLLASNDLSQFVAANGKPVTRQGWTVSDGVLHHTKRGGNLFFRKQVTDFSLSFDFKVVKRGNSGIKYRVAKYNNKHWLGCEYQIQDDGNRLFHKHATGSLYAVYEPTKTKQQNPTGQWNSGKIIVQGNRIQHWLNGILIVDALAGSADWNGRVAKSKFQPYTGWGQNPSGRIMIQDHGSEVWYKNMVLTKLPSPAPEPMISHGCCPNQNGCCQSTTFYPNCYRFRRAVISLPRCCRWRRFCR